MSVSETRYAKSGDVHIAYRVWGEGPFDLVVVPPLLFSLDGHGHYWDMFPSFERMSALARVIVFDKRGTGSSDPVAGAPSLEERMDDVRAVMEATKSSCAALLGVADGAAMSLLFAATYPERTFALALFRAKPRYVWAPDFPWAPTREAYDRETADLLEERLLPDSEAFERERDRLAVVAPGRPPTDFEDYREQSRVARLMSPPGTFLALRRMNVDIDVRAVLPSIQVPTLLMYRSADAPDAEETQDGPIAAYLAERIPDARLAEIDGGGPWSDVVRPQLEEFLPEAWAVRGPGAGEQRVLATVLFTDLAGSTAKAAELGPRWREVLTTHNPTIRRELGRFRGSEIDTAGDGFFASGFDGPARAIRCACAIRDRISELGLGIRVGVHTGECDIVDGKLAGLGVVIGSRIADHAEAGEVLVSGTVRDLVAGSGIQFEPRGMRELKGVDTWPLYAVVDA
jgi:pimeloyl-ACP methyl ester carboxylesterase